MSGLAADIHVNIAEVLASGDAAAAATLAAKIAAAQASGDAKGFDGDLAALQEIAGLPVAKRGEQTLQPLAKIAGARLLPPDLQARATATIAKMERATTPAEICAAQQDGERLLGDIRCHDSLKAALAAPRSMW